MDFEKFRRTGELSDITVIVDKSEFKLHKFPLFTNSDYFKKELTSGSAPNVIRLDNNFPGGVETFNQIADYFYSIPISIDRKNIVPLRSAACFIECDALSTLLDKDFDEILLSARAKYDLTIPLELLEQCTGEYQQWAEQTRMVHKCLQCIMESLTYGINLPLTKTDQAIIPRLALEWIVELIKLCSTESKRYILPFVKHYVTMNVLEQNQEEHYSAFATVEKKTHIPEKTADEKRAIIDEVVKALSDTLTQLPVVWLNSVYEKAVNLKCESEPLLSSYVTHAMLNLRDFDDDMENIPDDVMVRLLERVNNQKEDHIKEPRLLAKLSILIDTYIEKLRQRGTLTKENFVKLASCVPKEERNSYDSLLRALDDLLKNENSVKLSNVEREELLTQVDFSRVNEETIAACKSNKLIPQQLITDAAVALCVKLRRQLEETRDRLQFAETELAKFRPAYSSSLKYRSRHVDSSFRHTSRSGSVYSSIDDSSEPYSIYNYPKYIHDDDLYYTSPSRYLSSRLSTRYGSRFTYHY